MTLQKIVADALDGVPADAAHAPTPCAEWDVQALIAHLRQVIVARELAGRGVPVPESHWSEPAAPLDPLDATWAEPPATASMSGMQMPGAMVADLLDTDLVLHSWDLARATGRAFDVPDAYAGTALRFVTQSGGMARERGLFGDAHPVRENASPLERALALSGRNPVWSAPGT